MTEFNRDDYVTTGQAGKILGVAGETVRRWAEAGKVPSVTTASGYHLIHRDDLVPLMPTSTVAPRVPDVDSDDAPVLEA